MSQDFSFDGAKVIVWAIECYVCTLMVFKQVKDFCLILVVVIIREDYLLTTSGTKQHKNLLVKFWE